MATGGSSTAQNLGWHAAPLKPGDLYTVNNKSRTQKHIKHIQTQRKRTTFTGQQAHTTSYYRLFMTCKNKHMFIKFKATTNTLHQKQIKVSPILRPLNSLN